MWRLCIHAPPSAAGAPAWPSTSTSSQSPFPKRRRCDLDPHTAEQPVEQAAASSSVGDVARGRPLELALLIARPFGLE